MDCLKDFKGDEFKVHTQCISEEERYSAKGFVAKPNKNKGAQKQESWTETLQNLLNKPGLDHQTKNIIERIAAQTNVPRKKPKFVNFVKNSMKISMDNANKVWNVVEEALEEFKQASEANRQKKELEKKAENGDDTVNETNGNTENGEKVKKKKKKNEPKVETIDTEANESIVENGKSRKRALDDSTDDGGAKKKKKKSKSNETNGSEVQDNIETVNGETEHDSTIASEGKFDWQSSIVAILSKKKAAMAIDKLKSKVVKKYATQTSKEVTAGVEKKFLKKLKSTPNVEITNEFVALVK